jgi:hypothetical protein
MGDVGDRHAGEAVGPRFAELPVGYEFPMVQFSIAEAELEAYLQAVGSPAEAPAMPRGGRGVPPVAVAAFALRGLVGALAGQPGVVHGGQEYEFRRPVVTGQPLVVASRVANRTRRRGTVILIVEQEVRRAAEVVLSGRSMLAVPDDGAGA